MKRYAALFTAMIFLLVTLQVEANMSSLGATGLISIPTADTTEQNSLQVGYLYNNGDGEGYGGNSVILFSYGYNESIEAGLSYRPPADLDEIKAHLKIRLLQEGEGYSPALAFGAVGKNPYIAASKNIGSLLAGMRLHLGYGLGDLGGVFVGLEKSLNSFSITEKNYHLPLTTVMAEYGGGGFNFGLNFEVTPQINVKAHLANFRNLVLGVQAFHSF